MFGDTQLRRAEVQRADDCRRVAAGPSVNQPAQPTPHNHVARGDDLRAGVHIT